jgi:hypothetical protein
MKTFVLFHRLELTDLYSPLAAELADTVRIVHLAYGIEEYNTLRSNGVTDSVVIFKEEIKRIWKENDIPTKSEVSTIDSFIIEETNGDFNLNSAIQSDRGFNVLSYSECLKLTFVYYKFWVKFLDDYKVDYVLHEPTSLMMNFIAALLCQKRGATYIYQIMCKGENGDLSNLNMSGFDFTCPQLERYFRLYSEDKLVIERERCSNFITKFRAELAIYLGDKIKPSASWLRLFAGSVLNRLRLLKYRRHFDRCTDNIEYWNLRQNRSWETLVNLVNYALTIKFQEFNPNIQYYYYPLHLEPEAVVLYHGHGLYRNQIKLIENIAAQLPANTYLYVKDHPHAFGYRSVEDFKKLQKIPNIRLIRHDVPGKLIINSAIGVITITGTAGLEALLMGKQVYTLAKTFYSVCPRVTYIHHIRNLREAIYLNSQQNYHDDDEIYPYVAAYLDATNQGMVDYFVGRAGTYGIDLEANTKAIAKSILQFMEAN